MSESSSMQSVLSEDRLFPPPADFAKQAHVDAAGYAATYQRSIDDPEAFWAEMAQQQHWFKQWDTVLEWELPDAKWFVGGTTNLSYNCLDRVIDQGGGDDPAIIWEAEAMSDDGKPVVKTYSYTQLRDEVCKAANALKAQGVGKGDIVTVYLPMIPELAIVVLACARIGAVHSVIFGGFSSAAIRDRVNDGKSKIIVTADGGFRRGSIVPLKANVDAACEMTDLVETVLVVKHADADVTWADGRDTWWHELTDDASTDCPAEELDSEDLAFVLYTSGSTGKPKGIMHTTGGYMVYAATTAKYTFDLKPGDVYWCTADIGWITGHSYILYGVLPNRVPTLMYEGAPDSPGKDRFWDIVERHKVSKFYTAPTAIRAFMKWGEEHVTKHDLSSLKVLGTVGEPINPEAWMWYHRVIGGEKCPIVDTWWQTETGGHMITPLPGATTTTPGSCTTPFFGVDAVVVDEAGNEVPTNTGGLLAIRKPWPGMLRGVYGDRQRFIDTYWTKVPGMYCPGDGARKDANGNTWIMGRIDDVIVTAGHNLGTMEVESAIVSHPACAEAAVVGYPHDVKGNGVAAFIILKGDQTPSDDLKKAIRNHVGEEIGPIAKPDKVYLTDGLPKTRSGKIMRRLLRDIAAGVEITGDITTLEDKSIVEKLQSQNA